MAHLDIGKHGELLANINNVACSATQLIRQFNHDEDMTTYEKAILQLAEANVLDLLVALKNLNK